MLELTANGVLKASGLKASERAAERWARKAKVREPCTPEAAKEQPGAQVIELSARRALEVGSPSGAEK